MFASPLVFKMGYVKTRKKSCIARIVNSWHWIVRCAGKDIHYFCWHPFEKCHLSVCPQKVCFFCASLGLRLALDLNGLGFFNSYIITSVFILPLVCSLYFTLTGL